MEYMKKGMISKYKFQENGYNWGSSTKAHRELQKQWLYFLSLVVDTCLLLFFNIFITSHECFSHMSDIVTDFLTPIYCSPRIRGLFSPPVAMLPAGTMGGLYCLTSTDIRFGHLTHDGSNNYKQKQFSYGFFSV